MSALISTSDLSGGQTLEIVEPRIPTRVLHFSDGIVEEYSDDDTDDATDSAVADDAVVAVDEVCISRCFWDICLIGVSIRHLCSTDVQSKMSWGPWLWLKAGNGSNAVLERCDTAGEAIAAFLGITTPKYGYELEVYKRMQAERAARADEDAEAANWTPVRQEENGHRQMETVQPKPSNQSGGDADDIQKF